MPAIAKKNTAKKTAQTSAKQKPVARKTEAAARGASGTARIMERERPRKV